MQTRYKIYFYEDSRGHSPVIESFKKLTAKERAKVNEYIEALVKDGLAAGMPYIRHLDGKIWELRPLKNRILFAAWMGDGFVLLHYFVKKTQKTPRGEIEKAKNALETLKGRIIDNADMG